MKATCFHTHIITQKYPKNRGNDANEQTLKSQLDGLEKKLKELKIRHGLGDIDRETYDLTFNHLSDQIGNITKEMNTPSPKISNLEKLLSTALKKFSKLALVWAYSKLDVRRLIQKTLFPDGILYDVNDRFGDLFLLRNEYGSNVNSFN